jgi:RNA polymerase sigma-70 factor (ECF subfamily)
MNHTPGGFDAWMYRIARNAFADHGRKNHRESTTDETWEFLESGSLNPFEAASKKQETAILHRALKALSPERRELIVLTRFQGLSHEQGQAGFLAARPTP